MAARVLEVYGEVLGRLLPGDRFGELKVREGQFHYVVVGSRRVVCFARSEAAAQRLPARGAVLRALAGVDLGVAVPEYLPIGPPGADYLVMTRVAGAPLAEELLGGPGVAEAVARQCHDLLERLSIAGSDARVRERLPPAPADRWSRFAEDVRGELYPLMTTAGRERAERELAPLAALPHRTGALVHGDLGGENLLWDNPDGLPILRGVVDWDGACLGDPAEDYAAIGAGYGADILTRLLTLAGAATADLATRIATIQGTFALQQALDAHHDGDAEELADGLTAYRGLS
ncbi:phosphotransferase family protein [Nocardia sp. NPDC057030]|uniref:phosphotransferase family protein n=1 Tax=unclassified Nocardia TaxID=2637762 RepID=UPI00363F39FE